MMAVKRKGLLAGRHHAHGAAERAQAERWSNAAPSDCKRLAIAALNQRHVLDIDDGLFAHPTLPSRLIEISFCASTANSIGNCCSTSLTKPLTTSAVASSADMPRCRH